MTKWIKYTSLVAIVVVGVYLSHGNVGYGGSGRQSDGVFGLGNFPLVEVRPRRVLLVHWGVVSRTWRKGVVFATWTLQVFFRWTKPVFVFQLGQFLWNWDWWFPWILLLLLWLRIYGRIFVLLFLYDHKSLFVFAHFCRKRFCLVSSGRCNILWCKVRTFPNASVASSTVFVYFTKVCGNLFPSTHSSTTRNRLRIV